MNDVGVSAKGGLPTFKQPFHLLNKVWVVDGLGEVKLVSITPDDDDELVKNDYSWPHEDDSGGLGESFEYQWSTNVSHLLHGDGEAFGLRLLKGDGEEGQIVALCLTKRLVENVEGYGLVLFPDMLEVAPNFRNRRLGNLMFSILCARAMQLKCDVLFFEAAPTLSGWYARRGCERQGYINPNWQPEAWKLHSPGDVTPMLIRADSLERRGKAVENGDQDAW